MNGTSLERLREVWQKVLEASLVETARGFDIEDHVGLYDGDMWGKGSIAEGWIYTAGSDTGKDPDIYFSFSLDGEYDEPKMELKWHNSVQPKETIYSLSEGILRLTEVITQEGHKFQVALKEGKEVPKSKLFVNAYPNPQLLSTFVQWLPLLEEKHDVRIWIIWGAGWRSTVACFHAVILGDNASKAIAELVSCPLFTVSVDSCTRCRQN